MFKYVYLCEIYIGLEVYKHKIFNSKVNATRWVQNNASIMEDYQIKEMQVY